MNAALNLLVMGHGISWLMYNINYKRNIKYRSKGNWKLDSLITFERTQHELNCFSRRGVDRVVDDPPIRQNMAIV